MAKAQNQKVNSFYPYILAIGGALGVFAASMLTYEKINLLANPGSQLACDLNPIISCGSVINTDQASAFGFPNPFLGIAGFAVVVTIGMALLAGARFRRWFWLGLLAGSTFGILFVHWLIYQSLYNIVALCPYCMLVWAVTLPIFWYTKLEVLKQGFIKTPDRLKKASEFFQRHHLDTLLIWYLLIIGLILNRFWYYWETLI
ncbi:MAG TPA: vitamin K epoxide reductase family protein [Candidatus Saccharimonadales bacterium]|jgi:uncharacterized membrane protein